MKAYGLPALLMLLAAEVFGQDYSSVLYQEDFDSIENQDWELQEGWQVLHQGSESFLLGKGHSWASFSRFLASDYRLSFRLKLDRGEVHLVYRLGPEGRYFIGFGAEGSALHKQYWPDTFLENLTQERKRYRLGVWHQIEIEGRGNTVQFCIDGRSVWTYQDKRPLTGSRFAFECLEESAARIDDLVVYGPPPEISKNWVRTGGPLGGLGYDIRMRPDNPDILYVTDAWAGVFRSEDGGKSWFPINNGINTRTGDSGDAIPVFCLTIDPHDNDIIWVGTQNIRGIYRSGDGGDSWIQMDNGVKEEHGITFRGFAVDPHSSDTVYAAAEISSWNWAGEERKGREFDLTKGVVYKSTDGGKNWQAVWRGGNLARYVWIDPTDSDAVYVSTGIFDREAGNSQPGTGQPGGVGILKSSDGGRTWAEINRGLNNSYAGTLFMHPDDPDILLAGTGNNQYYRNNGVYLSSDGGASWGQTLQNDTITSVEFAVSDPDIAYAGSANSLYQSRDGGHTWKRVSNDPQGWGPPGVRAGFPIDFQVDPRDSRRVFANNYGGGNFLSTDGGRSWAVASRGYTGAQVRDVAVDPSGKTVYAAARSGIFSSGDGGSHWQGLNHGSAFLLEWNAVVVDPYKNEHLLAASNWDNILFESGDAGRSWKKVSQGPKPNIGWRSICFAPSDTTRVYAGTSAYYSAGSFDNSMAAAGIYISNNGGASWHPANDSYSKEANVADLTVDRRNADVVFAATTNQGVLKTTDAGRHWSKANKGLPTSQVLSIALEPDSSTSVFAGLDRGGIYRSDNAGASWESTASGMNPEASVTAIVFDPTGPEIMYAADRHSGVYRSSNGGRSWQSINSGLRTRAVNALSISMDGRTLYAATEGEGVYRLDLGD